MNPIIHMFMAHSIRKNVRKRTGEKLNLIGFIYGNILPDLAKRFDSIPHYMETSLNYISDVAAELSANYETSNRSFDYSKNMGIITHYIADYFCFPHTERFSKSMASHLWYEVMMTFSYRKGRKLTKSLRNSEDAVSSADLPTHLKAILETYNKERPSYKHDIFWAIKSCSAVASGVVCESALPCDEELLSVMQA